MHRRLCISLGKNKILDFPRILPINFVSYLILSTLCPVLHMKRFLALAGLLLFFMAPMAFAKTDSQLSIPVGRSELVTTTAEMGEVIVADPEVADIYVHGKNKVSVIGKGLGITNVRLFDGNNNLIRELIVQVTYDLPAIRKAIKDFLPYENVSVVMVNTRVALTGEVTSVAAADTALKIAEQFVQTKIKGEALAEAPQAAEKPDPAAEGAVLNLMKVSAGQQVMLRVRVGEIQRDSLKNLGVNLQAIKTGDTPFLLGTGGGLASMFTAAEAVDGVVPSGLNTFTTNANSRGAMRFGYVNNAGNGVAAMIEALEKDGLFKLLAEPNLVALSGEEAQFLAGGEFPIAIPQGDGTIGIEFKTFGVGVKFSPLVLSENRIRLKVQPEVSELSQEGQVTLNGIVIPALSTRRANTTIELAPGESFMIAGLMKDNMKTSIQQLPGLSEIPVLSALFRSTEYQRNETELVLAVTPYLVDPMRNDDVKFPTDKFRPASMMESVFYGALGSMSGNANRISQTPSVEGPIGFMVD